MAHHTEQVGFPAIPLNAGMKIRLRAIAPTTDTEITSVSSREWSIYGWDESPGPALDGELPRWVPEELAEVL